MSESLVAVSHTHIAAIWNAIRALPSDKRPRQVRHALDLVLMNLGRNTGEIMLTRIQLAEEMGCAPNHVSRALSTLEKMGAIRREHRPIDGMQGTGATVYFINPHVAWTGRPETRAREAEKHSEPKPHQ